ncbi:hypothetical protein V8C86DRAFT_2840537 [Haematococcus lacustris]
MDIRIASCFLMREQSGFINSFPFDPVGLNSPKHAVNEVKNGRLAMNGLCIA